MRMWANFISHFVNNKIFHNPKDYFTFAARQIYHSILLINALYVTMPLNRGVNMLYYKVIHLFLTKQPEHIHYFNIGIYDSKESAKNAIKMLKVKDGFCLRPDKFYILRTFRFKKPKHLNRTFWIDGYTTYTFTK